MRISDWSSDVCSSDLLVAREALAVPAAMLANERALLEAGEAGAIRETEAERCDVRAQRVIGGDRGLHECGLLRMDGRIDMPDPRAVGPAGKGALAHRGQIIGDELGAEFVAFVDDRPEHVRGRFEGESGRVADARHIGAVSPGRGVDLPDHRAIFLDAHAALADIAVRPVAPLDLRAALGEGS